MANRYFTTLARYNQWANRRLYDAAAQLSEPEYMQPRPSFFGSIHATLSHILVADRIWLARIEEKPNPPYKLDQILYGDLVALRVAREAEDARIVNLVAGIDERRLDQILAYANTKGEKQHTQLRLVLGHFFNHQTHHRGQVHGLLTGFGLDAPSLDLILFQRQTGMGLA
jgi:uncharacterized damage-inducible protein DinB